MRIEDDIKLDFDDVLIKPKRSTLNSRKDVNLVKHYAYLNGRGYTDIPIMAANMDGVGTFAMAEELAKHRLFTCLIKHYDEDELVTWIIKKGHQIKESWAFSMGAKVEDLEKFQKVYSRVAWGDEKPIKYVCIDVANGYHERFLEFIKRFKSAYLDLVVIAGNVATPEMTEALLLAGADIVKVGIGPGSVCTTRIVTGVGYPQLSAIIECADAAHGLGGYIIADGGCKNTGDIAKAFGAGADFVMLGGMLAGHKEGGNLPLNFKLETIRGEGNNGADHSYYENFDPDIGTDIPFYGMSSTKAKNVHGKKENYQASEGKEVKISYKGGVASTAEEILAGLRSSCSYAGARRLKDLPKCTTFVKVRNTHNRVFE